MTTQHPFSNQDLPGIPPDLQRKTKVLVVDDAAVDCALVAALLSRDVSLQTTFASDGRAGLAAIESQSPDIVITDLVMPELDGLELVRIARRRFPFVPVILMTGRGNEEIAVQALQAGAASYVPKRKLPSQLLETVVMVREASRSQRAYANMVSCLAQSEYAFVLHNDSTLFWPLIAYLQESIAHLGLGDGTERTRVGMALAEALANALYHGNLDASSEIQENDDRDYQTIIAHRSNQQPYCDRRIFVEVKLSGTEAVFVIRDEGCGFDPSQLPDPTDPANLERVTGRGILLMRTFMDEVCYNATGNEVRLVKRRSAKAG